VIEAAQISRNPSPGWITWLLLVGAVVLFAWGWFVLGFLAEPSAIGGVKVALLVIGGCSMVAAVLGIVASGGLIRRTPWATRVALVASVLMILSVIGVIMGVPALIGLISGRLSDRT
jgi:hypothetical protein